MKDNYVNEKEYNEERTEIIVANLVASGLFIAHSAEGRVQLLVLGLGVGRIDGTFARCNI
tara:strand:+ start:402 stop:581 length:180 start_codon:yes stop_codon:yes gene_type:complete